MHARNRPDSPARREAIRSFGTLLLGGFALGSIDALIGARVAGATEAPRPHAFTAEDIALLDEVAETILPATTTPGARAAGVGAFMALMASDALRPAEQQVFREGIKTLEARCRAAYGAGFMTITPGQRTELLQALDGEQSEYMRSHADDKPAHWFRMMKGMAVFGFFTSEVGYTQMARYVETPGRYEPAATHASGEKNFVKHTSDIGGGRPPVTTDSRQCRAWPGASCTPA